MPLTPDGLEIRTVEEINEEFVNQQQVAFGPTVATGPFSVLGQLNAVIATQLRVIEELLLAVYTSFSDSEATGQALERIAAYTGTTRRPATQSVVELSVTCDDGTDLDPGELIVATSGIEQRRFVNIDPVLNDTGISTTLSITAQSELFGPTEAPAGTLTVIAEPAPGVTAVTNAADATLGREEETDAQLRARRIDELSRPGTSTVDALRVDVVDALSPDARTVIVFENPTDVVDGDGLPPHSVEVLVYDGTVGGTLISDDAIAQAVFDARPAGIATHGSSSGTAVDSRNQSWVTNFSRPTPIAVDLEITIDRGSEWTAEVDTAIKEAVAIFLAANLSVGQDLVLSRIYGPILGASDCVGAVRVPQEVVDVTLIRADSGGGFMAMNVVAGVRDLITVDSADITILYA